MDASRVLYGLGLLVAPMKGAFIGHFIGILRKSVKSPTLITK